MFIDRRTLLTTSGRALALALVPAAVRAQPVMKPPVARIEPVTETRFGTTLVDPYRWMENGKDKDWEPFMRGQAAAARTWFDKLPGRAELLQKVSALSGDTAIVINVQPEAGKLFYEMRPVGANNYRLYVREGDKDRVLIDPEAIKDASGAHSSLDFWSASPDGRHVAYGLSPAGSENSVVRIIEVATGRILPDTLDRAQYASPSWLPDSSGFFLMRGRPEAALGSPDYYAKRVAWLHRLGTAPATDTRVFGFDAAGGIAVDPFEFPIVVVTPASEIAILLLVAGVRRELRLLTAPLADVTAGRAKWRAVCEADDRVTNFALKGHDLYLISEKDAPLGRLLRVDARAPDLAGAAIAVPEGKTAMEAVGAAADAIYVQVMDGGNQRFLRLADGRASDVAMPFNASIFTFVASPDEPGFIARLSGWLSPTTIWRYDPGTGALADTGLSPKPAIDLSPYEAVNGFATARDGTKIPVTVVARKGLKRDGSAPLLADAYGAYQISQTPALNTRNLPFLDAGGVLATVGVRGGGEYGRPWNEAGKKATKPNTWRDLIDACKYLIKEGWTSTSRLAIIGGSAGGITVGRALTEEPQLFGLVASAVGVSNPVRGEVEQNNGPNIPEFGSAQVEADFPGVLAMDSYMSVKDGTAYPIVLLTTGMTDPRVAPWHAAKMAARLQAATSSGKPIILRVDFEAGHGMGSTREQRDAETADLHAAVLALR